MIWQDFVVSFANFLFSLALINQVFAGYKMKKNEISILTSSITTLGIYAMGIVFFSLGLIYSGTMALLNGTLWLLIFLQGIIYKK